MWNSIFLNNFYTQLSCFYSRFFLPEVNVLLPNIWQRLILKLKLFRKSDSPKKWPYFANKPKNEEVKILSFLKVIKLEKLKYTFIYILAHFFRYGPLSCSTWFSMQYKVFRCKIFENRNFSGCERNFVSIHTYWFCPC